MSLSQLSVKHMPALDGLRGLACLLVVAAHIAYNLDLPWTKQAGELGSSGVMIFFSLSGFLMGSLYLHKPLNIQAAGHYLISRFSRITPAYYIAVTLVFIIYQTVDGYDFVMGPWMLLRSYLFMGSAGIFWSIPPEIQFYIFFLFVWLAYQRSLIGKHGLAIFVGIISLIFILTREKWGGILLPSMLHIFLLGVAVAKVIQFENIRSVLCLPVVQIGLVLLAISYAIPYVSYPSMYQDIVYSAVIAFMVGSLSHSTIVTKPLETASLRYMGFASFSIYLFHQPILLLINAYGVFDGINLWVAIFISCSVGLLFPCLFHHYIEKTLNASTKSSALKIFENRRKYFKI